MSNENGQASRAASEIQCWCERGGEGGGRLDTASPTCFNRWRISGVDNEAAIPTSYERYGSLCASLRRIFLPYRS